MTGDSNCYSGTGGLHQSVDLWLANVAQKPINRELQIVDLLARGQFLIKQTIQKASLI